MSDFTPSFTHPHLHSPNPYFLNDPTMLSPSNQPPKSADYIKIHDQDTNSSASKDYLAQSNRSNPHAFPHELTFHPSQEPPRSILRPIQDYNNMANPRVHYEKPGQIQQENIEGGGLGLGLISGFLKETFKQDNSAMNYLNKFSNVENIPQGQIEVQKQVKRPPKYQPPKAKPATNIHNRSLQSVQEEQSREEDEELRPYSHIPQPVRTTRAEKKIIERSRSNSKERKLEEVRKNTKSPDRFPGEDQSYKGLKRFYKNIVMEKKTSRQQKIDKEKDDLEHALFGDDKENVGEAALITTKRSEIQTTSATHKPAKSLSTERQVGLIVRQSPKSSRQEIEFQQRIMLKDERDVIGKGVTWLTTKHPWKVNVLKMTESEMAEALEVMKTEKDWRGKVIENIEGIFEMPEESIVDHVNSSYDLEENSLVIGDLLGLNRSIVFYYINFLQKFSNIGILKEIAENKAKIKKLNMGLSKLKRENNKIKKVMTDGALKKGMTAKKDPKKPELKRTSYQENETMIMMMIDIRSRLMQKNVLLAFKWLSGSARIRNELINVLANAYNRNLFYHIMSGMYFSKQLGLDKKKQQYLANDYMRKYWLKELMGNWRERNRLSQLKRARLEGARDFFLERLKRRGFYGILIQIQYKKTLKADDPLVNKFREYQFTKKMFLAFKYSRKYTEIIRDKKLNPQVNYSSKPIRDPRERTITDAIVRDSQRMGKVILNKLMILSSKRDYYYEPLRQMKTLLTPKYSTHYPQSQFQEVLSALTPISPGFHSLNQSMDVITSHQKPQPKAFIYKKKKYALDKLTHENVFTELKEHIRSLVTTRQDLESLPITLAEPPRGMINVQSLERFYEEREEKRLKATFMNKWKIAFLEKWTNVDVDLYHSMYLGKAVIQKMRSSIRQGREMERDMGRERTREMMRKVFGYFKKEYMGERDREDMIAYGFQMRKWMECWKLYYAKRKAKRELYRRFSANYYYQITSNAFKRLREVTQKNRMEREFRHHQIQKRAFNKWIKKFNNRIVLGNVFGEFMSRANHYVDYVPKNNFQLLSGIMRAWRQEVIDNEHTADQKINNLVAENHRNQAFKVKVFRAWKEVPSKMKSLALMTRIFKVNFRKNVFKKWSYITQYTLYRMATLQENEQKLKLYRCFQALYKFSLQQKLIRAFQMRRIFNTWQASFHLRTQIFPRRCHTQYLSRAFFNALKNNRKKKILGLKQKFLAQQQYKRITLPLMGKAFYRFVENMVRNKKKKAFYDRLTIFRIKTVMRGIMKAWRGRVFQRILKEKKIRLAEDFREDRQALWTQPQNNKKTIIARYQMLNLAFSGWRAQALKGKNEKHIVQRFRKFRERINKRSLFNHWYQQYRDRRINSYQLPSLNISFSRYLKTDAQKMSQYGGKINQIDSKRSYETAQWADSRSHMHSRSIAMDDATPISHDHTRSIDLGSLGSLTSGERDLWMTSYKKNEEFMRKLNDMKEMEKKSFKKYF